MLPAIWHRYIFLFGIIALASGMLFGTVPTSIPQMIIAGNWLIEKDYAMKWARLKSNKVFLVLISIFLLHLLGMLYTSNIARGLDDLRNKVPLFILPVLFFSTKPLSQKEFKLLFSFFFLSVVVSSICCFLIYSGYTQKVITDAREASIFMSHIRFSLFIAFAIIGMGYQLYYEKPFFNKTIYLICILWLLFFMYKLELVTGFLILIIIVAGIIIKISLQTFNTWASFVIIACFFGACLFFLFEIKNSLTLFDKSSDNRVNKIFYQTANNRIYLQDTLYGFAENGNLIGINISDYELNKEWNLKSKLPYSGTDIKGNNLRQTVLRYMASKGLTKDSVGINALTSEDISNIEYGFTNFKYVSHNGLISRWRELIWEYTKFKRDENPSGHTLTMRLEFWKTAIYIIKENPLIGVGTGDIQDSFNKAYVDTNSKLDKIWWLRCHNQYLAITVSFGILGLFVFLFYLCYPSIALNRKLHPLYWSFLFIALLSFITEDTLETQSGVTFFIFFQTLFLWLASYKEVRNRIL